MLGLLPFVAAQAPVDSAPNLLPVVLKKGTPLKLMLLRPLSSQTSAVNTVVDYCVAEDLKDVQGDVIVPAGSVVTGKVTDREKPNVLRWYGLLGIDAEAVCLKSGDSLITVPLKIQESPGSKYHDFRTRTSLAPPKPKPEESAKFASTKKPVMDQLLNLTDPLHRSPNGALTSGITAASAVLLAQIIDPKDSQTYQKVMSDANLISSVRSAKSIAQIGRLAKTLGAASTLTIIGIGIGLWELYDLIGTFFRQTTIASGTIFTALVAEDQRVDLPVKRTDTRGFWSAKIHFQPPKRFADTQNVVCVMDPSPYQRRGH